MTIATRQNRTLIDTLSAGYGAVNRRLWVLLLPVIASVYFAYGQPVSLAPIIAQARAVLAAQPNNEPEAKAEAITLLTLLEGVDMRQPLLRLSYLPLLSAPIGAAGPNALVVRTPGQLLAVLGALNGAALLLGAFYLQQLARAVAPAAAGARGGWRPGAWARLVGSLALWAGLVVAIGVGLGVPYLLLGALVSLALPPALPLMLLAFGFVAFWAGIYVGFSAEAMALDGVGPLRAALRSARLVRRNFLPTIGLLLLGWLITNGMTLALQLLAVGPVGLSLVYVASAYVGSGLAAARMVYYRERAGL